MAAPRTFDEEFPERAVRIVPGAAGRSIRGRCCPGRGNKALKLQTAADFRPTLSVGTKLPSNTDNRNSEKVQEGDPQGTHSGWNGAMGAVRAGSSTAGQAVTVVAGAGCFAPAQRGLPVGSVVVADVVTEPPDGIEITSEPRVGEIRGRPRHLKVEW